MSDSRSKSLRGLLSTCAWGALAAAIGCGGGGSDGPPSTTVTGTRLSTYWQDDGSTISVAPTDTGGVTISALVYENGAYRESMGTTDGSGNLTITDVGTGAYFLRYASPGAVPRYYLESARRLDLGADQVGRTTRPIAQLATPVTFSVTGLDPWAAGDAVSLFTTGGRFGTGMTGAPLAGDTAGDFTVDFKSRPLPQANDLGWVLQTAPRTAGAGAVPYTAVVRSVAIQTLESLPDGTAVTLGPLPLTVPPQGTVGMDLRRSQFLAALPSMAPSATVTSTTFNFGVSAVPRSFSLFYSGFYRSMLNGSLPAGTTDVDLGSLS